MSFSCAQPSSSVSQAPFAAATSASRAALLALQASDRALSRAASASAAAFASPQMPTEIVFTSPSIFASASTWMIFASFGQYSIPYCGSVPNGPSRVPRASTTSALAMSFIAALLPW